MASTQDPDQARAGRLDRREYRALVRRVLAVVDKRVPSDATVLVISRGDSNLLRLGQRRTSHFPQNAHGVYAGHYPAGSTAAITHLEVLRARGAEFLLIPATSLWWLTHYRAFGRHLERRYRAVVRQPDIGVLYALHPPERPEAPATDEQAAYSSVVRHLRELAPALLPAGATVLVLSKGDERLVQLDHLRAWHFPRGDDGGYAGAYPATGDEAVAHLESLRQAGAAFLIMPTTALWWLTEYRAFARHLRDHCRLVTHQAHVCTIYALGLDPGRP